MNSLIKITIIILIFIKNTQALEKNETIFKISEKSYTLIDIKFREKYLQLFNYETNLEKKQNEIINDYISIVLFKLDYKGNSDFNKIVLYKSFVSISSIGVLVKELSCLIKI